MTTTTVFKASVAAALIALYGAAGLAVTSAPAQAQAQATKIEYLPQVVITGHRTQQVATIEHLPRVVITGHRSIEGVQVAKACTQADGNC